MDLGYGGNNQAIGNAATAVVLQTTKAQESAINDEMDKYDALLNSNDDDLEEIRQRRIAQMKKLQKQKEIWRQNGHGAYTALGEGQLGADCAKMFFDASKKSERLVVHFHRPTTRHCDIFHRHLETIAKKHLETRFVKIDVEDAAENTGKKYLVDKLGILMMPTLLVVINREATHHVHGFDELGGDADFSENVLAFVLGVHGALHSTDVENEAAAEEFSVPKKHSVNSIRLSRMQGAASKNIRGSYHTSNTGEEYD